MAERAGVAYGLGRASDFHPYYQAAVVYDDTSFLTSNPADAWDYGMYLNAELACAYLGTFPEGSDPEVWVRSSEGIWKPYEAV